MTQNRRIVLNIVATYGRSLYALVIGLITARWTLMALGQVDYGLVGVVGGLSAFISFFNGLLASAIGRFYAFSVGKAQVGGADELEDCRRWFSIAVLIHTAIPLVLVIIGYPIGIWAVKHFLTIPPDRIDACVWVFRFVCVTCFVGMVNVPYNAMYGAKQYIAELTIYSFVTTTLNAFFLYYMVSHPGVWLVRYSLWTCILAVSPQVIICLRAMQIFPECRFRMRYCWDWHRLKELTIYAFWQFFGSMGGLARAQGTSIIVNKFCGPVFNASMNIGNSVASHCDSLAASLSGAFSPAITNLAGAGDREKMLKMCYLSSKMSALLCLVFVLPLSYELDFVLKLWLRNPPPMIAEATSLIFVILVIDKLLSGVNAAVFAEGEIGSYCFVAGMFHTISVPIMACSMYFWGTGFMTVFYVLLIFKVGVCFLGVPIARSKTGFSILRWSCYAVLPVVSIVIINVISVSLLRYLFHFGGLAKVLLSIISSGVLLLCSAALIGLSQEERLFIGLKMSDAICKFKEKFVSN